MDDQEALGLNQAHVDACHERWIKKKNRPGPPPDEDTEETWANEQCGGCRYYIPLQGPLQSDWGACSNAASPLDGTVRFEHDGCNAFEGADAWVGEYYDDYERRLLFNRETSNSASD